MKQASYWDAIVWIAENDSPNGKPEEVEGSTSVGLIADIFGETAFRVSQDILMYRTGYRNRYTVKLDPRMMEQQ